MRRIADVPAKRHVVAATAALILIGTAAPAVESARRPSRDQALDAQATLQILVKRFGPSEILSGRLTAGNIRDLRISKAEFRVRNLNHVGYLTGVWQAQVLAGVLHDIATVRKWDPVAYVTVFLVRPGGRPSLFTSNLIAPPEPAYPVSRTAAQLRAAVTSAVRAAGADISAIQVFPVAGRFAVLVRVKVPGAQGAARRAVVGEVQDRLSPVIGSDGTEPVVEGLFLDIRSSSGQILRATGYAVRCAQSISWTPGGA